jgi:phage terminase Nu1 subunit (DNA packaging protein)
MAELFGVTRQTIHDWYRDQGLPQNTDGTFDLARAIPWYEEFTLKKAVRGKDAVGPLNPFQTVKTERERLRLEQDRGELIEREAVIGFQVSMMQNIVNAFNAVADLANRVFGQSREEIVALLEDFRDEIMGKMKHVPAELKLSEPALMKLTEFYEVIKPQKNAKKLTTESTEIIEKG